MTFGSALLLLLWVVASLFFTGIPLLHRFTRLRGIELLSYGVAAGVSLHTIVGWAIAAAPPARRALAVLLIVFALLGAGYMVWRRVLQELFAALSAPIRMALFCWFLLLLLGLGLLQLSVRFPQPLTDGIYIFKTPTTNVKVQYLTSLPADNYIPFAVSEFFLRGISFQNERPILPGTEVSNRTVLMSLVALPFRAALGAPYDHLELGRFNYIGRDWPDVAKLNTNGYLEQFSVIGLVLNSLLLLGVITFCANLGAGSFLPWAALLYVSNAYFIGQTIYTWPKALAGFFILLAWNSIRAGHRALIVAALMGLAFHSHPYAIVFAGWVALFYLWQFSRGKNGGRALLIFLVAFSAIVLPWLIWTRYCLQIPSDLVAQNFTGPGTEPAWASPMGFIWIRLHNFFYTVCSTIFIVYPFDLAAVLNCWLFSLPGAVGLILIYPALAQCVALPRPRPLLWYGLVGPALSILAVYSCPALPVLHGYQAPLALLLFLGVWWLSQRCRRRVYLGLVGAQLLLNLGILFARAVITGAHF